MRRILSIVGVAVLVVVLAGCDLFDWPQYGANGGNTGTAQVSALRTSTVPSLGQRWTVSSPNVAPATLAVVGPTVYASSALNPYSLDPTVGITPPPPPPLEAHSVVDGSLRWSAGGASITAPNNGICVNNTAGTVPVVTGGQYYYLSETGQCLFEGHGISECGDSPIDAMTGVAGAPSPGGADGCISSDPVAASDGTVYVARTPIPQFGPGPNGLGAAVVGSDGSVYVPDVNSSGASLSTPAVDATSVYVVSSTGYLIAFDRASRQERWSTRVGQLFPANTPPTPSVADGRVFVATQTSFILAVFEKAQAFDAATGQQLWSVTLPDEATLHAPAATGSTVFVRTGSTLLALDASSGATSWQASLGTAAASSDVPTLGSPSVANDVVFVGTQDDRLLAFDTNGCGAAASACGPIFSAALSGPTGPSRPALTPNAVYISAANGSAGSNLYKFSLSGR